ncbi:hypothetical protein [Clostridium perfringens]|uniref:hypothetical protein n=1 Tax=Clostridium perfringens TaxID=1502 RepID=UPI003CF086B7
MEEKIYEYERLMKKRPHVVILGAGASVATIPNGDKNGKKISVMNGFIEKLGMTDILANANLRTTSENLEDIYSELDERLDCIEIKKELENKIEKYFLNYELPDSPTIYDFLLLSLTNKDLVATFNWDPLLLEAYQRVSRITNNLPNLAFLHGNVAVGVCEKHKIGGYIYGMCHICNQKFSKVPLLYPVKQKDYNNNLFIRDSWNALKNYLKRAYMVTIFGYSAPKSDESAIEMLKEAWGMVKDRNLEEIEIIDIREEEELVKSWEDFIHTHHYSVHKDFFESSLGKFPRRTCESLFDRTQKCYWLDSEKGFKKDMNFNELKEYLNELLEDEKNNNGILKNPYL